MDSRYSQIKQKFKNRFSGVSSEKADYMFDSDNYDSDGDGLSNIEEPSEVILLNDNRSIKPKPSLRMTTNSILPSISLRIHIILEMTELNIL